MKDDIWRMILSAASGALAVVASHLWDSSHHAGAAVASLAAVKCVIESRR